MKSAAGWGGDLVEAPHPLLVGNALGLELGDQQLLRPVDLPAQDGGGVIEHRLDDAQQVQRVGLGGRVEPADGVDEKQGQVVEEREVDLEVVVDDGPVVGEAVSRAMRTMPSRWSERTSWAARASVAASSPHPRGSRRSAGGWRGSSGARVVHRRVPVQQVDDHARGQAEPGL